LDPHNVGDRLTPLKVLKALCNRCAHICNVAAIRDALNRYKHQLNIPDSATLLISTPCSLAMKPSTEKIAKPAYKLVELLMTVITTQFLIHKPRTLYKLFVPQL